MIRPMAHAATRTALILFPHQIFEEALCRRPTDRVYLIEHPLHFTQFRFHKQKLVLHRATMASFAQRLTERGIAVRRLTIEDLSPSPPHSVGASPNPRQSSRKALRALARIVQSDGCTEALVYDLDDDWLESDLLQAWDGMPIRTLASPMFLTDIATLRSWFGDHPRPRMADFYRFQRRRLGVLMDDQARPVGGQWSYDAENRRPWPRGMAIPARPSFGSGDHVRDAVAWVERTFPDNYGAVSEFDYPTTHDEARALLRFFLTECLEGFGDYEDAMVSDERALFHSMLAPALNIGFLTPAEVIAETLGYAAEHPVRLNSLEGFIRQVIGWREFVRGLYHAQGRRQRTMNRFGFRMPVPEAFWRAGTGLLPADTVIRRVLKAGYCHHIERLMVLGSLMLLCEVSPDAVYEWFMTLFIDAYDWVMVPNVYGMSQYADDGIMATKPYISGSAYLRRMGDWQPGSWERVWDALYWRFVDRHRDVFLRNPRAAMAPRAFDRMAEGVRRAHHEVAEEFLRQLDGESTVPSEGEKI